VPSSQSLVPKDRPYGERKQLVEQMQRAGVPLAPGEGGPQPGVGDPAASPPGRPTSSAVPQGFDVFDGREPTQPQGPQAVPPPASTGGIIAETAATSPNPFIAEFAARLAQLRR